MTAASADATKGATKTGAKKVGAGWMTLFTLAWLALWTVQLTPVQLLLPLQLNTPDDADGWIRGVVWSGMVLAAGGIAAIIAGPLAGALSDRTTVRLGRRRPWALGGTWLGTIALVLISFAEGPWAVGLAWIGVSVGVAVASAAFTALIADQLTTQRGAASAAVGSAQAVGIVVGVGVIVVLGLGVMTGYLVLAGILVVVGTVTALLLPDPVLPALERSAARQSPLLSALRDRDFAWMLAGRFTVNLGNALGTTLLLFFLMYGIGSDAALAEEQLLLLIVVYTVFIVIASIVGGMVSDRIGKRRGMAVIGACIQGVASLMLAAVPTLPMAFVAAALLGVGYGIFSAVGLAFATDLLPYADDNARDLGIVNVSVNLGQLLGPLIGAGLVALVGGFWLLFAVGALLSIVGAFMTRAARVPAPIPTS